MAKTGFVELSQYPCVEVISLHPRIWTFPVESSLLMSTARAFDTAISLRAKAAPVAPTYCRNSRRSIPSPRFFFSLPSFMGHPLTCWNYVIFCPQETHCRSQPLFLSLLSSSGSQGLVRGCGPWGL